MSLVTLFKQGSSSQLELMPTPAPEPMAETMVAFANGEGGTLVFGLEPDGKPTGDELLADTLQDSLARALALCRPPIHTQWEQVELPDGSAVALRVARSSDLHSLSDGRVLVRSGAENRTLSGDTIRQLAATKATGNFELETVAGATRADFDDDVIGEYLEKRRQRQPRSAIGPTDLLLRQIGAVANDGAPTVCGMLLFGKEPQLFLPQAGLVFVKFVGTEPRGPGGLPGYGRREEIVGPFARVIEQAWRVCWEEMDKEAVVRGLQREEKLEYPSFAVREALVNAVCHRDYRLTGRRIEVRMFEDRLEVASPGGLPGYMTVDNIVEEHFSRNPRLVNGLYQWGYIEELGLGVDRMIEEMLAAGHPPPSFRATPYSFTVTLYNAQDQSRAVPQWERNMNERQLRALQYVEKHGSITNREYRELCAHVSAETLRLDLADLVEKGVLLKVGDKRGTHYILK